MVEASEPLVELRRAPPELAPRRVPVELSPDDDIIDLRRLSRVWIRWSWVPILAAIGALYFGYQDLKRFNPQHLASMVVLPSSGGASPAVPGGVSAIAAQFGIQIAPQQTAPFDRLRLTLGSIELAQAMQERHQLMQRVYQGNYDEATGTWVRPTSPDFERQERLRAFLRQNQWTAPSLEDLANYIGGSIRIEPAGTGTFLRLSVTHQDGDFALWLLNTSFAMADEILRSNERKQSLQRRAYIERELSRQTIVAIQDALRGLLGAELSREISLEGNIPYAASIVQAPYLSNSMTEPNIMLLFGLPVAAALALGFLLITLVAVFRMERN